MEKKGTPASPATALARSVLPVPGGPTSRTPLGILAPSFRNFCGSRRNSTISPRSSFSSYSPATSANVAFFASGMKIFARLFPKLVIVVPAPPFWRLSIIRKNTSMMAIITIG